MLTRRDLYQAHRLMVQRMGMALVHGEPDAPESPLRRQNIGVFCGVMVAIVACAGFGVWGLVKPGGTAKLDEAGSVIVERETGAVYIFSDKKLIPVANYTSARLVLDSADVNHQVVSRSSLAKLPRGQMIGIPGAPGSLPEPGDLVRAPWSVCVQRGDTAQDDQALRMSVTVGRDVGGRTLADGEAAAVRIGAAKQAWLVWGGKRHSIPDNQANLLGTHEPTSVGDRWLNALPIGPDIAAPVIDGMGRTASAPGGGEAAVGQVFHVPEVAGGEARWYVMLRDGLAPISQMQAILLLQDPQTKREAYDGREPTPIRLDAATANSSPQSRTRLGGEGLLKSMPKLASVDPTQPLCAVYGQPDKPAQVTIGGSMPAGTAAPGGPELALPSGGAVLAQLLPGQGQQAAGYSLITDQGRRFTVPGPDLLTKLGYEAKHAVVVHNHLLHMIPEGPALDPVQAKKPISDAP